MPLKHFRWSDVEEEQLKPDLGRQLVVGNELMLARVLLKKGCVVPEHSHVNEQLTYILDGCLRFWIDGKVIDVRAGEVLCIPRAAFHDLLEENHALSERLTRVLANRMDLLSQALNRAAEAGLDEDRRSDMLFERIRQFFGE